MDVKAPIRWSRFLWDVFMCSLSSFGGPEAHYGVFSSTLVEKRKYLTEEELTEMIGLFALVPGPSSTQTITAIGYYVGGPVLALLTFFVWAFPAIITMTVIGVFFSQINANETWKPITTFLPAVAVGFILFAALTLTRKVVKRRNDILLYGVMLAVGFALVRFSMWVVPLMLVLGGAVFLIPHLKEKNANPIRLKPRWVILGIVIALALLNEGLRMWILSPWVTLYTSFYRYGYSVIGGGQIVIPLMIRDLVEAQTLIALPDFLSGYAIDQAIPGPLFSFAAFVGARSFSMTGWAFLAGLVSGLSIFLPGILLVYFIFPIWKNARQLPLMKHFLKGVTITAASLILMTAISQIIELPVDWKVYSVVGISVVLLWIKKFPAPLIVVLAALLGFLI